MLAEKSGVLTVKARNYTDETNAEWVKIEINDTGQGIPKENIEKIFATFFTTKGEGRGFGLWRAKTIIENLGGNISVTSQKGTGTTFTILLPKTSQEE